VVSLSFSYLVCQVFLDYHHRVLPEAVPLGTPSYLYPFPATQWMAAGYINTCANILAPAMVDDRLCVRASALMALTFQVSQVSGHRRCVSGPVGKVSGKALTIQTGTVRIHGGLGCSESA